MADASASLSSEIRRLAASTLALGRLRLELLTLELQEEKERLIGLLFWAVLSALAVGFALVFAALAATAALWESHRGLVLGLSTAAFVAIALLGAWRLRRLGGEGSALLKSTLDELKADERALRDAHDGRESHERPGAP